MHPLISAPIFDAMKKRGMTELTLVQQAVLDSLNHARDLRITSQTGSGKTLAFGFAIAHLLSQTNANANANEHERNEAKRAKVTPKVIVIAPTRELAVQVKTELEWVLKPVHASVLSVTGGTHMRLDLGALKQGADVIVGTPGRLADHVREGRFDPSAIKMVVLDEADEMLDMGFRDELETVLEALPEERLVHLVSATFAPPVAKLANRYQPDALAVRGTELGAANTDISHLAYLIVTREKYLALVNVLLMDPGATTLVFARTREGASEIGSLLRDKGFLVSQLTGEMEQRERTRALDAFRSGQTKVLVATDVAARGIDLPFVTRIIQADLPDDPDALTHRSGRTGRAGRKGLNILLVPQPGRARANRLVHLANLKVVWASVPSAAEVQDALEKRMFEQFSKSSNEATQDELRGEGDSRKNPFRDMAKTLLELQDAETLVSHLLACVKKQMLPCEANQITSLEVGSVGRPGRHLESRADKMPKQRHSPLDRGGRSWVRFKVTWGRRQGADPRRIMAMACRRGNIQNTAIGSIDVGLSESYLDVDASDAHEFEASSKKIDPRDPRVFFERASESPSSQGQRSTGFHPSRYPSAEAERKEQRVARAVGLAQPENASEIGAGFEPRRSQSRRRGAPLRENREETINRGREGSFGEPVKVWNTDKVAPHKRKGLEEGSKRVFRGASEGVAFSKTSNTPRGRGTPKLRGPSRREFDKPKDDHFFGQEKTHMGTESFELSAEMGGQDQAPKKRKNKPKWTKAQKEEAKKARGVIH